MLGRSDRTKMHRKKITSLVLAFFMFFIFSPVNFADAAPIDDIQNMFSLKGANKEAKVNVMPLLQM